MLPRCCFQLLLAFAAVTTSTPASTDAKGNIPHLSAAQWREDLHVLATGLARYHKNAFHLTPKKKFDSAVAQLDRRIPSLSGWQIMVGMMHILALVGDGHTRSDDLFNNFSQFPLDLYWFDGELRVIRTTEQYKDALGARVIAIGSTSIIDTDKEVRTLIEQGETEGWVKRFSAFYLACPEILAYFGIIGDLNRGTYRLEKDGREIKVDVESVAYNANVVYIDAAPRRPMYRRDTEKVWFTYLPEANLTYFAFNHYPPAEELKKVAAEVFKTVDEHHSALAIDFRNNGGGDYIEFDDIVMHGLQQRAFLMQQGRLFGLIGRNTFSAAMMNALQLREKMHAILVGEPTGARPNSYSEAGHFKLPNSHFEVQYSRRYYNLVAGDPAGVVPDKVAAPSWPAYKNGEDPALKWILQNTARDQTGRQDLGTSPRCAPVTSRCDAGLTSMFMARLE